MCCVQQQIFGVVPFSHDLLKQGAKLWNNPNNQCAKGDRRGIHVCVARTCNENFLGSLTLLCTWDVLGSHGFKKETCSWLLENELAGLGHKLMELEENPFSISLNETIKLSDFDLEGGLIARIDKGADNLSYQQNAMHKAMTRPTPTHTRPRRGVSKGMSTWGGGTWASCEDPRCRFLHV